MIVKCSEVSSGDPTLVPQQEVSHQPVMRHRSACRNGAQRWVLGPVQERGTQYKRVIRIEEDIEVSGNAHALSDGHVDRCGRIRHRRKSSGRLFRKLSPTSTKHNPDKQQWPSDQHTAALRLLAKCQVSHAPTGRCLGFWFLSFLFAVPARARRSMAAALSTRLLRRRSCR